MHCAVERRIEEERRVEEEEKSRRRKILLVFNELEVLKLATGGPVSGSPAPRAPLHAFFMAIFFSFFV